jgi:hypothetical protein
VRQFPLLDLKSAWKDLHALLTEIQTLVEILDEEAEHGWPEMRMIRDQVRLARVVLGALPPAVRAGIVADWAEFARWEALADAQSY